MKSRTTARFRKTFGKLPERAQERARETYHLFERDPQHPSLRFKRVHSTRPVYSVRISLSYRALGVLSGDEIIWFWIGSHDDYERLIAREL